MRKIKEVLRLKWACKQSKRAIAQACGIGRTAVADYLVRAEGAGLTWPISEHLNDEALEALLFPVSSAMAPAERSMPDLAAIHKELKGKGVTLALLWEELRVANPNTYSYSQFCHLFAQYSKTLSSSMRMTYRAGEKMFVDYAGPTVAILDSATGEIRQAQIFVSVLGASHYTYAEATWTQNLSDWIGAHVRALSFYGGVTEIIVPDNLRSAVSRACRYEPEINPTYQEFAEHYGTAIIPARSRRPKDKARVEAAVLLVERWLLACLRHQTLNGLEELNAAIGVLLERLNHRKFKKLVGSRRSQFEELDRPALKALPEIPYVFAEWKKARVHPDYHVEVDHHYYSVPNRLIKQQLDVRMTGNTVECFHKGSRVASHLRSWKRSCHTTVREHMPLGHQLYHDWTPERLASWAAEIGVGCSGAVTRIMSSREHPQQGFRSCFGLLSLEKHFGGSRLEAACQRAVALETCSYRSVKSILEKGLDGEALPGRARVYPAIEHENIRGAVYFH